MIDTNNDGVDLQSGTNFQIFDNLQDGVTVYGIIRDARNEIVNLRVKYINNASIVNEVISCENATGKIITELYDNEISFLYLKVANDILKSGKGKKFKTYFKSLDRYYSVSTYLSDHNTLITISTDITEKEKMGEKLQKQADLLDLTRDAIIVRDMGDRVIFWNHGAEERYGWKRKEAYGKVAHNLLKTEFSEPLTGIFGQLFQNGHWEGEVTHTRRDSEKIVVLSRWELQKNENNEPTGYMEINTDITKRKKMEKALKEFGASQSKIANELEQARNNLERQVKERTAELEAAYDAIKCEAFAASQNAKALKESETQLRMITDNMIDMVSQTDIHGVIQYASPSCKTLLGYELEELIGTSIFDYIPPDSLGEVKSAVKTAFTEMTPGRMEVQFKHADGHYIWLEIAGSIFFNEKRLIKGAVFGSRDISERKNAEMQIKRQYYVLDGINRIFRESLTSETEKEVSEVGLNVAEQLTGSKMSFIAEINDDRSLNGIAVSFSALKLYNASPSEIPKLITHMKISKYIRRVIKEEKSQIVNYSDFDPDKKGLPEGHPQINSFLCVPLKQGDKLIGLIALANKDGNYTFEDVENIESLSIAIVEAVIGFKSKNKLKKYKNRLEETIGDLKRSNEELQRFAYVASHDLQEPLRTIASFTQLLERRYKGKLDGNADEFINYIVEAALRMKEQIKGLLEYSRISTNENEFKNVNSEFILNQAIDNLQFAIKENNAEITYESMPVVMCDAGQLQRVFQNLISNAIKFKKEDVPPKIHISIKKDNENQEYVFSVLDNGIGIEKQYMGRIFVIFQRLHTIDEYHGTGIGLSIVKRIIERHGGRIWVESKFGTGSAFYFTIPYSK